MRFILQVSLLVGLAIPAMAQDQEIVNTERTTTTTETTERSKVGLALEPMLIYGQETANIRTSQLPIISDDTTAGEKSAGIGLKLGGHIAGILTAGVDGRYSRTRLSDSSYGETEGDKYTVGPTLGVQMPVAGLRVWGTYVVAGGYDPSAGAQGFDLRFNDPRGYRMGVGFHIGAVSLNLEYEDLTFQNTEIQSFGGIGGSAATAVDFDSRGYMASLSFPIEL